MPKVSQAAKALSSAQSAYIGSSKGIAESELNIKNIEEDYVFGQSQINKMIRDSKKIEKKFDRNTAIDYINREFGSTFATKHGGIRYYKKKFNLLEDK